MTPDRMSSRERWEALVRGDEVDRVPCLQFILGHTAVVSGQPIAKIYDDAAVSFACQRGAMEMYGYDGLVLHGWANAGGAEFGGEVEYPYRKYTGAPMIKANPVRNEDDAWNLRVPADVAGAGTVPVALEFSRLQHEHGMPCTVQVGSPLTWAGSVCGEERLMVWLIKKPDLVHQVLRVITDFILQKARLWVDEFGPENVMAFDLCIETNRLYSPKQFETFSFPYLKEVHDRVTELGVAIFLSHICGEQNKNLPYWAQLRYAGRGMVSVGREIALSSASAAFPGNVIVGNVDPVTIQEGTPEQVLSLCRDCVAAGRHHPGGYALMSGCEVPPQAPPVNVFQMVKACREYGRS
ncbi:MAG: uroporphyrinogen decarboxylase family protein [Thermoleophilia bacterium]